MLCLLLAAVPAGWAQAPAAPAASPVTLSAFEVTTSRDLGYQSSNSAELTRMNMAIADLPLSVTVFKPQFLKDVSDPLREPCALNGRSYLPSL